MSGGRASRVEDRDAEAGQGEELVGLSGRGRSGHRPFLLRLAPPRPAPASGSAPEGDRTRPSWE